MASDPGQSGNEGKIMASSANMCGLCDQYTAIKQCRVCPVDLCVNCVTGHQKLPSTRDHQLTDIVRRRVTSQEFKDSASNGACTKHGSKPFTILCRDCVDLGCDSCETDHDGHSVQALNDDPKLCHRVCDKNIQQLLDDVHELEEIKSVLNGQICVYEDAIVKVDQWEIDLMKLVREKAAKVRKKLNELRDQKYKQLSDQVNGLMAKLKDIDKSILQLTTIRKSMDFGILSNELSKSKDLVKKLERYKSDLQPLSEPISVDDVLPNGDKIKDVNDNIEVMVAVGDIGLQCEGALPVAEWCFTGANMGKDLSVYGKNHVTMTNVTYGPGPQGEAQEAVVVTESKHWSMTVMNPDEKLRFGSEMTFYANFFLNGEGGYGRLFLYDTGMNTEGSMGTNVYIHKDQTQLRICSGQWFDTPHILTPDSWNKLAIIFRPATVSVYVNGSLVHTEHISLDLSHTHKGHLHFGRRPGCPGLDGRIASCKLYDVALNDSAIERL